VAFLLLRFFLVFVALSARNRRQVFLFENPAVVQFVSGDNVCQCPYRDFILVAMPRRCQASRSTLKTTPAWPADLRKFFRQIG